MGGAQPGTASGSKETKTTNVPVSGSADKAVASLEFKLQSLQAANTEMKAALIRRNSDLRNAKKATGARGAGPPYVATRRPLPLEDGGGSGGGSPSTVAKKPRRRVKAVKGSDDE